MKRKVPEFRSDKEAAAFPEQDLSDLDFTQFKPAHFEFERKTVQINMRLPRSLLDVVKQRAAARGIPYTRFIREALEQALAGPDSDTVGPARSRRAVPPRRDGMGLRRSCDCAERRGATKQSPSAEALNSRTRLPRFARNDAKPQASRRAPARR